MIPNPGRGLGRASPDQAKDQRAAMETAVASFIEAVKSKAQAAGVFGSVEVVAGTLRCAAPRSTEPAWFRLEQHNGHWHVSLVTANRWLSESIEADLMHHGDPMEELIEEELIELGHRPAALLEVKHFRSDDLLYTFRSPLPVTGRDAQADAEIATAWLLAYEAAFRQLGDMDVEDPRTDT